MPGKTHSNIQWLNVKNGKLQNKQVSFDSFEGNIVQIERKEEEYEGNKYWAWILTFNDGTDTVTKIQMREESWYCYGFFARLIFCNAQVPVELGAVLPSGRDKGSYCYIRQNGILIDVKSQETRDLIVAQIPEPKVVLDAKGNPVKVNNRELKDWTDTADGFIKIAAKWNATPLQVSANEAPQPPASSDLLPF